MEHPKRDNDRSKMRVTVQDRIYMNEGMDNLTAS